jgi:hypothetical protein
MHVALWQSFANFKEQCSLRPPGASEAAHGNGNRSKSGSGRKGRRKHKRHVAKHAPGNP